MRIYFLGSRSLAKAEGVSVEEAGKIWSAAHNAIIYQGAGRLGLVLLVCLAALVFSHAIDGYCGSGFCNTLEFVALATAFLLFPVYLLVAMSIHAKKICDAPDSDRSD